MKKLILLTIAPLFFIDACSSENKITKVSETSEVIDTNHVAVYVPVQRDIKTTLLIYKDENGNHHYLIKAPLLTADKPSKHKKPKFRGEEPTKNSTEVRY